MVYAKNVQFDCITRRNPRSMKCTKLYWRRYPQFRLQTVVNGSCMQPETRQYYFSFRSFHPARHASPLRDELKAPALPPPPRRRGHFFRDHSKA